MKNLSTVSVDGGFVSKETNIKVNEDTRIITATGIIPVPPTVYPGVFQLLRKKYNHNT